MVDAEESSEAPYKQAIVLRSDLDLSAGKAVAQGAHASQYATDRASNTRIIRWRQNGTVKITLSAPDEPTLRELQSAAEDRDLPTAVVVDEGRTELDADTVTALAIGPGPQPVVDAVTGNLALY